MSEKITQKNITVENGDVIGRDKHNHFHLNNAINTRITSLSIAFKKEIGKNIQVSSILPELQHYMSNVDSGEIIGLEVKLKAGNKLKDLPEALRQKEIAAKRLHKHSTSKAAQDIYTYILGLLLNRFRIHISPMIEEKKDRKDINRAIFSNVIEPTINILEDNVLELHWDDIWGMIYYLTGNCHIKWNE